MQFEFCKMIGDTAITFKNKAENDQDFFRKISFFMNDIPSVGPNGETDLCITHRRTKDGYEYFSVVSKRAGQEFCLGQTNDDTGRLFPKKWQPLYDPEQANKSGKTPKPAMTEPPKEDTAPNQQQAQGSESGGGSPSQKDIMDEYL